MRSFWLSTFLLVGLSLSYGQANRLKDYVTISLAPNHADWIYKVGEMVEIEVAVIQHQVTVPNVEVTYEWGTELLPATETKSLTIGAKGRHNLRLKGAASPGFMTCKVSTVVDGKRYSNYVNVGFEPDKIETTTQLPADFEKFWAKSLSDARRVALDPIMTLQPDLCTAHANVYHIRFCNTSSSSYMYGMLSVPKKQGRFAAILRVPGAGVRAYSGDRDVFPAQDIITLEMGIHGIPVNMDGSVYQDLRATALARYNSFNNDDRDLYYYKRVYLGCVKAVDFLTSLPEVDASKLAVYGGSQGGALSIVVAALEPRIKCLAADYPALSEIGGFYYGKVGGWPKIFRDNKESNLEQKIRVSQYYDVVNFARFIKVPGLYIWGYNDQVCCPTSTYAAYNQITAPKTLKAVLDCGHWLYPEHAQMQNQWLIEQLTK